MNSSNKIPKHDPSDACPAPCDPPPPIFTVPVKVLNAMLDSGSFQGRGRRPGVLLIGISLIVVVVRSVGVCREALDKEDENDAE